MDLEGRIANKELQLSEYDADMRMLETLLYSLGVNDPKEFVQEGSKYTEEGYVDARLNEVFGIIGSGSKEAASEWGMRIRVKIAQDKVAARLPSADGESSHVMLEMSYGKGFVGENEDEWHTSIKFVREETIGGIADAIGGYTRSSRRHAGKAKEYEQEEQRQTMLRELADLNARYWKAVANHEQLQKKYEVVSKACEDGKKRRDAEEIGEMSLRDLQDHRDQLKKQLDNAYAAVKAMEMEFRTRFGREIPDRNFLRNFGAIFGPLAIDSLLAKAETASSDVDFSRDLKVKALGEYIESSRERQSTTLHYLSSIKLGIVFQDSEYTAKPVDAYMATLTFVLYGSNWTARRDMARNEHIYNIYQLRKRQAELPVRYQVKLIELQAAAEMLKLELANLSSATGSIQEQYEQILKDYRARRIDFNTMKARLDKIDRDEYIESLASFLSAYEKFVQRTRELGMEMPDLTELAKAEAEEKAAAEEKKAEEKKAEEKKAPAAAPAAKKTVYTAENIPSREDFGRGLKKRTGWRWGDHWDSYTATHTPEEVDALMERYSLEPAETNKAGFYAFCEGLVELSSKRGHMFGKGGALYRYLVDTKKMPEEDAMKKLAELRDVYWKRFWQVQEEIVKPFLTVKLGYEPDIDNDFALLMAWTDFTIGSGKDEAAMIKFLETSVEGDNLVAKALRSIFKTLMVEALNTNYDKVKDRVREASFHMTADQLQGEVETRDVDIDEFSALMAGFESDVSKFLGEEIDYNNEADSWILYRAAILALRAGGREQFSKDMELMTMIRNVSGEFFNFDEITADSALRMPGGDTLRRISDMIHELKAKGEDTTGLEVVFNVHMQALRRGKKVNTCYDFVKWVKREIDNTSDWLSERNLTLAEAIKKKKEALAAGRDFYVPMFVIYVSQATSDRDPRITGVEDLMKKENRPILERVMRQYFRDLSFILTKFKTDAENEKKEIVKKLKADLSKEEKAKLEKRLKELEGYLATYDTNNPFLVEATKKWVRFYRENFKSQDEFNKFLDEQYRPLMSQGSVKEFLRDVAGIKEVDSLMSEDMMIYGGYLAIILQKHEIDAHDEAVVKNFCNLARQFFQKNESLRELKLGESKEQIKYFIGLGELMGTLDSVARRSNKSLTDILKDKDLITDIGELLKKYKFEYVEVPRQLALTEDLIKGKLPEGKVVMVTAPIVDSKFREIGESISIKDEDNKNLVTFARVKVHDSLPTDYAKSVQRREVLVYRRDSVYPQEIFRMPKDTNVFTLKSLVGAVKIGTISMEEVTDADGKVVDTLLVKKYLPGYTDGLGNLVVKINRKGYGKTVYEEKMKGDELQKIYYEYYDNDSLKSVKYEGVLNSPDPYRDPKGYFLAEQHGLIALIEYERSDDPTVTGLLKRIIYGDGTIAYYTHGNIKRIVFGNPHKPDQEAYPVDYDFARQHEFITEMVFDGTAEERPVLTKYKDGTERRYVTEKNLDKAREDRRSNVQAEDLDNIQPGNLAEIAVGTNPHMFKSPAHVRQKAQEPSAEAFKEYLAKTIGDEGEKYWIAINALMDKIDSTLDERVYTDEQRALVESAIESLENINEILQDPLLEEYLDVLNDYHFAKTHGGVKRVIYEATHKKESRPLLIEYADGTRAIFNYNAKSDELKGPEKDIYEKNKNCYLKILIEKGKAPVRYIYISKRATNLEDDCLKYVGYEEPLMDSRFSKLHKGVTAIIYTGESKKGGRILEKRYSDGSFERYNYEHKQFGAYTKTLHEMASDGIRKKIFTYDAKNRLIEFTNHKEITDRFYYAQGYIFANRGQNDKGEGSGNAIVIEADLAGMPIVNGAVLVYKNTEITSLEEFSNVGTPDYAMFFNEALEELAASGNLNKILVDPEMAYDRGIWGRTTDGSALLEKTVWEEDVIGTFATIMAEPRFNATMDRMIGIWEASVLRDSGRTLTHKYGHQKVDTHKLYADRIYSELKKMQEWIDQVRTGEKEMDYFRFEMWQRLIALKVRAWERLAYRELVLKEGTPEKWMNERTGASWFRNVVLSFSRNNGLDIVFKEVTGMNAEDINPVKKATITDRERPFGEEVSVEEEVSLVLTREDQSITVDMNAMGTTDLTNSTFSFLVNTKESLWPDITIIATDGLDRTRSMRVSAESVKYEEYRKYQRVEFSPSSGDLSQYQGDEDFDVSDIRSIKVVFKNRSTTPGRLGVKDIAIERSGSAVSATTESDERVIAKGEWMSAYDMDGYMYYDLSVNGEPRNMDGTLLKIKAQLPHNVARPGTIVYVSLIDAQTRAKSVEAVVDKDGFITVEIEALTKGNFDPREVMMLRVESPMAEQGTELFVWGKIAALVFFGIMVYRKISKWLRDKAKGSKKSRTALGKKIVSHVDVNKHIRENLPEGLQKPKNMDARRKVLQETLEAGLDAYPVWSSELYPRVQARIIEIKDLYGNTGVKAHLGLGRVYGEPVIYVDSLYKNEEELKLHELYELREWIIKAAELGLTITQVRIWIRENMDEARTLAAKIHNENPHKVVGHMLPDTDIIYDTEDDVIIAAAADQQGEDQEDNLSAEEKAVRDRVLTAENKEDVLLALGVDQVRFATRDMFQLLAEKKKVGNRWVGVSLEELKDMVIFLHEEIGLSIYKGKGVSLLSRPKQTLREKADIIRSNNDLPEEYRVSITVKRLKTSPEKLRVLVAELRAKHQEEAGTPAEEEPGILASKLAEELRKSEEAPAEEEPGILASMLAEELGQPEKAEEEPKEAEEEPIEEITKGEASNDLIAIRQSVNEMIGAMKVLARGLNWRETQLNQAFTATSEDADESKIEALRFTCDNTEEEVGGIFTQRNNVDIAGNLENAVKRMRSIAAALGEDNIQVTELNARIKIAVGNNDNVRARIKEVLDLIALIRKARGVAEESKVAEELAKLKAEEEAAAAKLKAEEEEAARLKAEEEAAAAKLKAEEDSLDSELIQKAAELRNLLGSMQRLEQIDYDAIIDDYEKSVRKEDDTLSPYLPENRDTEMVKQKRHHVLAELLEARALIARIENALAEMSAANIAADPEKIKTVLATVEGVMNDAEGESFWGRVNDKAYNYSAPDDASKGYSEQYEKDYAEVIGEREARLKAEEEEAARRKAEEEEEARLRVEEEEKAFLEDMNTKIANIEEIINLLNRIIADAEEEKSEIEDMISGIPEEGIEEPQLAEMRTQLDEIELRIMGLQNRNNDLETDLDTIEGLLRAIEGTPQAEHEMFALTGARLGDARDLNKTADEKIDEALEALKRARLRLMDEHIKTVERNTAAQEEEKRRAVEAGELFLGPEGEVLPTEPAEELEPEIILPEDQGEADEPEMVEPEIVAAGPGGPDEPGEPGEGEAEEEPEDEDAKFEREVRDADDIMKTLRNLAKKINGWMGDLEVDFQDKEGEEEIKEDEEIFLPRIRSMEPWTFFDKKKVGQYNLSNLYRSILMAGVMALMCHILDNWMVVALLPYIAILVVKGLSLEEKAAKWEKGLLLASFFLTLQFFIPWSSGISLGTVSFWLLAGTLFADSVTPLVKYLVRLSNLDFFDNKKGHSFGNRQPFNYQWNQLRELTSIRNTLQQIREEIEAKPNVRDWIWMDMRPIRSRGLRGAGIDGEDYEGGIEGRTNTFGEVIDDAITELGAIIFVGKGKVGITPDENIETWKKEWDERKAHYRAQSPRSNAVGRALLWSSLLSASIIAAAAYYGGLTLMSLTGVITIAAVFMGTLILAGKLARLLIKKQLLIDIPADMKNTTRRGNRQIFSLVGEREGQPFTGHPLKVWDIWRHLTQSAAAKSIEVLTEDFSGAEDVNKETMKGLRGQKDTAVSRGPLDSMALSEAEGLIEKVKLVVKTALFLSAVLGLSYLAGVTIFGGSAWIYQLTAYGNTAGWDEIFRHGFAIIKVVKNIALSESGSWMTVLLKGGPFLGVGLLAMISSMSRKVRGRAKEFLMNVGGVLLAVGAGVAFLEIASITQPILLVTALGQLILGSVVLGSLWIFGLKFFGYDIGQFAKLYPDEEVVTWKDILKRFGWAVISASFIVGVPRLTGQSIGEAIFIATGNVALGISLGTAINVILATFMVYSMLRGFSMLIAKNRFKAIAVDDKLYAGDDEPALDSSTDSFIKTFLGGNRYTERELRVIVKANKLGKEHLDEGDDPDDSRRDEKMIYESIMGHGGQPSGVDYFSAAMNARFDELTAAQLLKLMSRAAFKKLEREDRIPEAMTKNELVGFLERDGNYREQLVVRAHLMYGELDIEQILQRLSGAGFNGVKTELRKIREEELRICNKAIAEGEDQLSLNESEIYENIKNRYPALMPEELVEKLEKWIKISEHIKLWDVQDVVRGKNPEIDEWLEGTNADELRQVIDKDHLEKRLVLMYDFIPKTQSWLVIIGASWEDEIKPLVNSLLTLRYPLKKMKFIFAGETWDDGTERSIREARLNAMRRMRGLMGEVVKGSLPEQFEFRGAPVREENAVKLRGYKWMPRFFRVIITRMFGPYVEPSQPYTKPGANTFALKDSDGAYGIIYDTEDKPEDTQILKFILGLTDGISETRRLQDDFKTKYMRTEPVRSRKPEVDAPLKVKVQHYKSSINDAVKEYNKKLSKENRIVSNRYNLKRGRVLKRHMNWFATETLPTLLDIMHTGRLHLLSTGLLWKEVLSQSKQADRIKLRNLYISLANIPGYGRLATDYLLSNKQKEDEYAFVEGLIFGEFERINAPKNGQGRLSQSRSAGLATSWVNGAYFEGEYGAWYNMGWDGFHALPDTFKPLGGTTGWFCTEPVEDIYVQEIEETKPEKLQEIGIGADEKIIIAEHYADKKKLHTIGAWDEMQVAEDYMLGFVGWLNGLNIASFYTLTPEDATSTSGLTINTRALQVSRWNKGYIIGLVTVACKWSVLKEVWKKKGPLGMISFLVATLSSAIHPLLFRFARAFTLVWCLYFVPVKWIVSILLQIPVISGLFVTFENATGLFAGLTTMQNMVAEIFPQLLNFMGLGWGWILGPMIVIVPILLFKYFTVKAMFKGINKKLGLRRQEEEISEEYIDKSRKTSVGDVLKMVNSDSRETYFAETIRETARDDGERKAVAKKAGDFVQGSMHEAQMTLFQLQDGKSVMMELWERVEIILKDMPFYMTAEDMQEQIGKRLSGRDKANFDLLWPLLTRHDDGTYTLPIGADLSDLYLKELADVWVKARLGEELTKDEKSKLRLVELLTDSDMDVLYAQKSYFDLLGMVSADMRSELEAAARSGRRVTTEQAMTIISQDPVEELRVRIALRIEQGDYFTVNLFEMYLNDPSKAGHIENKAREVYYGDKNSKIVKDVREYLGLCYDWQDAREIKDTSVEEFKLMKRAIETGDLTVEGLMRKPVQTWVTRIIGVFFPEMKTVTLSLIAPRLWLFYAGALASSMLGIVFMPTMSIWLMIPALIGVTLAGGMLVTLAVMAVVNIYIKSATGDERAIRALSVRLAMPNLFIDCYQTLYLYGNKVAWQEIISGSRVGYWWLTGRSVGVLETVFRKNAAAKFHEKAEKIRESESQMVDSLLEARLKFQTKWNWGFMLLIFVLVPLGLRSDLRDVVFSNIDHAITNSSHLISSNPVVQAMVVAGLCIAAALLVVGLIHKAFKKLGDWRQPEFAVTLGISSDVYDELMDLDVNMKKLGQRTGITNFVRIQEGDREAMIEELKSKTRGAKSVLALLDSRELPVNPHTDDIDFQELEKIIGAFAKEAQTDIIELMHPELTKMNAETVRKIGNVDRLRYVVGVMARIIPEGECFDLNEKSIYDIRIDNIYNMHRVDYTEQARRYLEGIRRQPYAQDDRRYLVTAVDKAMDLKLLANSIRERREAMEVIGRDSDPVKDIVIVKNQHIAYDLDRVLKETELGEYLSKDDIIIVGENETLNAEDLLGMVNEKTGLSLQRSQIALGAKEGVINVDMNKAEVRELFSEGKKDSMLLVQMKGGLASQLYRMMIEIAANGDKRVEWAGDTLEKVKGLKVYTYLPKMEKIDLEAEIENYERYISEILVRA
ncbi:MAG: hypothetical protein WBD12_00220 [Candidatus Omnitrophota bacterium]